MKKRFLALLLAATMTMGMTMTAFAQEGYSITINQVENANEKHTYEAYQIFKGKLTENNKEDGSTERILSDIEWGDNVDASNGIQYKGNTYTDASSLAEVLAEENDAKDFAAEIANYITGTPAQAATESEPGSGVTLSNLPDGYYLVKDKDESLNETSDAYSRYIIQIAGTNVEVTAKADVPSVEKKVKDKNDTTDTTGEETVWQDSADYDIGDEIPFQFSSIIVDNIAEYQNEYIYTFHDIQSDGLTFAGKESVTMTVGGSEYTGFDVVTNPTDGCTFEIKTGDLRGVADKGDEVIVEYKAILNEDAEIGSLGNPNKVYLTYSNNPNGEGTGKTPEDTVIVFTYKVVINKVTKGTNGEMIPLEGAKFKLSKKVGNEYIVVKDEKGEEEREATPVYESDKVTLKSYTFEFKGIDDGQYKLEETQTPAGYNTLEPVEFKVEATHTNDDAGENALKLTDLNGNPVDGSVDLGFTAIMDDGSLTADVINNKGSLLPSTGGMGTTIFYILGGILVVGAGVVLFARKRMSHEEE